MKRLTSILERTYGTPDLGNLRDPLDEAVYIVITYQTDIERAKTVWRRLRKRFPTWNHVLKADVRVLERVLTPGGFQSIRARLIRRLLRAVEQRWGELSLSALSQMDVDEAEAELRALPGLDIKGSRCVLLYSLGKAVLPVDSNTFRFMQRYGVVEPNARYRRQSTHNELQTIVPASLRHSFHVNVVAHGQRVCVSRNPKCDDCQLAHTCVTRAQ